MLSRHAWWLIRRPFLIEALSSSVQDWLSIHWCRDIDMKFIELHVIESVATAARFPKLPIIGYWNMILVTEGEDPLTLELSSNVCWIQSVTFLANINGNALLGLCLKSWRHDSYTRCACRRGSLSLSYIWNGNTHVQSECALTDRREGVVLHFGGLVSLWLLPTNQEVDYVWNVMAHAQKPDFVFRRNGRVHLNRRGRQFSRLLAAEVCVSAVVMLDTPCYEVVWRVLAIHSICQFPLHFPSRASPCAITFQLDSIAY